MLYSIIEENVLTPESSLYDVHLIVDCKEIVFTCLYKKDALRIQKATRFALCANVYILDYNI